MDGSSFNPVADENLGSMMIALAVSLVLFGVVIIQGYSYYQAFGDDRASLKLLVTVVLGSEFFHSVMITYTIYLTTVTMAGKPGNGPNTYPLTTSVVLETLITALVQSFFAFRIYRLSGTLYISIVCWALSLLRLGGGLALAAESYMNIPDASILTAQFGWLITLSVIVGAVVDVTIAASLCYYLWRLSSPHHSLKSTSELINRLMIWVIQTGIITSMASVGVVIAFHIMRDAEIWFAIYMVLAKLYSNSFLVSLNVRRRLAQKPALSGIQISKNTHLEFHISTVPGLSEGYDNELNSPSDKKPSDDIDLEAQETQVHFLDSDEHLATGLASTR